MGRSLKDVMTEGIDAILDMCKQIYAIEIWQLNFKSKHDNPAYPEQ